MAITFVRQGTSGSGASVTSVAPSFSTNTTVGNAVILTSSTVASSHISSANGFGVTVWTDLIQQTGTGLTNEIWGAIVVTAGTSVTVNYSASSNAACLISEVSGVTLTTDGSSSNQGGTGQPGNVTTTNANDFVISSIDAGGSATVTDPGSPWNALTRVTGGSSSGKVAADAVYQIVTSTGSFNPSYTFSGGTGVCAVTLVALRATVTATPYFLQPFAHRQARKVIPYTRAKRALKGAGALFHPREPQPPFPTIYHAQKRRLPVVKPKPRVRNRWLIERQVTAPHADFPEQIRRQAQKKRIPQVKAKRVTRSSIELRIPQAYPAPLSIRHARGQTKRLPRVKAKGKVQSSIELRIPQAPTATLPLSVRHQRGQPRRLPSVKAKRVTRSSIELRIPQAPPATLPLSVRHQRGQTKRLPRVKAKRKVYSSVELRIPQAPPADLPLAMRHPRGQSKRIPHIKAKRVTRSSIELRIPQAPVPPAVIFPPTLRHARGQPKRTPWIRAKRVVRSSLELRIPQAPHADFPQNIRRQAQRKPVPRVKAKLVTRSSIQLRIPQAPPVTLPLSMRHPRGQTKRLPQIKAKRVTRSSIELRIPQTPHPNFPQSLRRQAQKRRIAHVKAKRVTRSNIELRIPQAPPAFAPMPIRGRAKRKFWYAIRAKHVTISKFMQLSKTLAPFIPPPPVSPDILARWRVRGGPAGSRIHGQV